MKGEKEFPVDNVERDYKLIDGVRGFGEYIDHTYSHEGSVPWPRVAIDTESHDGREYSIQFSTAENSGRMILFDNNEMIIELGQWLREVVSRDGEVVLHNAPADLEIVDAVMGGWKYKFRDTMQEAYQLGLPQGLKALSYRLLGRRRKSWEETVIGPSKEVMGEWLIGAVEIARREWRREIERFGRTGKQLKGKVEVSKIEKGIENVLSNMTRSDEYEVWERFEERVNSKFSAEVGYLECVLGEVPKKGIGHCSTEELVEYGCSDADVS